MLSRPEQDAGEVQAVRAVREELRLQGETGVGAEGRRQEFPGVDLQGAGHASFFRDADGKRFLVYHAYPYNASKEGKKVGGETLAPGAKGKHRNAYVEPYRIDYGEWNGTGWGVLHIGAKDDARPAPPETAVSYALED